MDGGGREGGREEGREEGREDTGTREERRRILEVERKGRRMDK
jgi:hypothetical protein